MGTLGGPAVELFNTFITFILADTEPSALTQILSKLGIIASVALGIGLVIFVHELGHFVAAKACGVKCEKFYVGFDPPLQFGPIKLPSALFKFQWGETEYGIGVIPLGGYVKMLGQDDDPRKAAQEAERIRIKNENAEPGEEEEFQLDPRSYQAKPVWQRMIIISAGVIVNVVTAMMFGAIAFWFGVPYTPAIVGNTVPGDPAWVAGLEPGSQIVSVCSINDDEKLQFRDMTMEIIESGIADKAEPISLKVRKLDGTEESFKLTPTLKHDPKNRAVSIGVAAQLTTELPKEVIAIPRSVAAQAMASSSLKGGTVTKFNGQEIPETEIGRLATPVLEFLAKNPSKPLDLEVQMTDGKVETVTIPPHVRHTIGCTFRPGPITGVVQGSAAHEAGVAVGDRIVSFNGETELSNFGLYLMANNVDAAKIEVQRGEGASAETLSFDLKADCRIEYLSLERPGTNLALGGFGIAYEPSNVIATIQKDCPLDEEFDAGDLVTEVSVAWPDKEVKEELSPFVLKFLREDAWEVNSHLNTAYLVAQLQRIPENAEIRVLGQRGSEKSGKVLDATVKLAKDSDAYWHDRGLRFMSVKRIHTAESVADACSLGYQEAGRRGKSVLRFLKLLVTGKLDRDVIGGPVAIFSIAGSHAAEGMPRLLIFLTFLSVNLAILNFLPIPALDGGHMVFLIAEAVLGRPVDEERQAQLTVFGFLFLLSLMAFAFYNDIARIFSG